VNLDVVFNHHYDVGLSCFDRIVPYYYFRVNENGTKSNGSYCGNDFEPKRAMFRKYIVDTCAYYVDVYGINGFRFDLMAIHEKDVMKEVYDELYKIDPNVMVYGEPWDGGGTKADPATTAAVKSDTNPMGAGAFDDDFRNAIKGGEFGGFGHGQVQGTFEDAKIVAGLQG
jgi:pullulanase